MNFNLVLGSCPLLDLNDLKIEIQTNGWKGKNLVNMTRDE